MKLLVGLLCNHVKGNFLITSFCIFLQFLVVFCKAMLEMLLFLPLFNEKFIFFCLKTKKLKESNKTWLK